MTVQPAGLLAQPRTGRLPIPQVRDSGMVSDLLETRFPPKRERRYSYGDSAGIHRTSLLMALAQIAGANRLSSKDAVKNLNSGKGVEKYGSP